MLTIRIMFNKVRDVQATDALDLLEKIAYSSYPYGGPSQSVYHPEQVMLTFPAENSDDAKNLYTLLTEAHAWKKPKYAVRCAELQEKLGAKVFETHITQHLPQLLKNIQRVTQTKSRGRKKK